MAATTFVPYAKTAGLPNKGGIKIRLIIEDHGGRPERGQAIAERMITQEKVHILQGAFQSAVAAPASQVAEKYGIPFRDRIVRSAAADRARIQDLLSVTPTTEDIARDFFAFLDELRKDKGVPLKNLGVIHINDNWGSSLAKAAEGAYRPERGRQADGDQLPDPDHRSAERGAEAQERRPRHPASGVARLGRDPRHAHLPGAWLHPERDPRDGRELRFARLHEGARQERRLRL